MYLRNFIEAIDFLEIRFLLPFKTSSLITSHLNVRFLKPFFTHYSAVDFLEYLFLLPFKSSSLITYTVHGILSILRSNDTFVISYGDYPAYMCMVVCLLLCAHQSITAFLKETLVLAIMQSISIFRTFHLICKAHHINCRVNLHLIRTNSRAALNLWSRVKAIFSDDGITHHYFLGLLN